MFLGVWKSTYVRTWSTEERKGGFAMAQNTSNYALVIMRVCLDANYIMSRKLSFAFLSCKFQTC